jgi:hypothetical protein
VRHENRLSTAERHKRSSSCPQRTDRSTHSVSQGVPGSLPLVVKRPGRETNTHLYLVPRVQAAILQFLDTSDCTENRNIFTLNVGLETQPIVARWTLLVTKFNALSSCCRGGAREGLCASVTVPGDQEILLHWRRQTSALLSVRLLSADDILSAADHEASSTPMVVLPSCSLTAGLLTQVCG